MAKANGIYFTKATKGFDFSRLPAPYNGWKSLAAAAFTPSKRNTDGTQHKLNAYITRAAIEYAKGAESEIGVVQIEDGRGGNESAYAAQMKIREGTLICYITSNGVCHASIKDEVTGKLQNLPNIGNSDYPIDLSAFFMLYMLIEADKSREKGLTDGAISWSLLQKLQDDVSVSGSIALEDALLINDHLVAALTDSKEVTPISFAPGQAIMPIKQPRLDRQEFASGRIICGNPDILKPVEVRGTVIDLANYTIDSLRTQPDVAALIASHNWTEAEKLMIPSFPGSTPVPKEIAESIFLYVKSRKVNRRNAKKTFNNFGWKGTTGYGKSTGVAIMACTLQIPLLWMTCSSNSDREWFMSAFVPDCGDNSGKALTRSMLPTFDDYFRSPSEAYEKVTGKHLEDEEITEQMFMDACFDALSANSGPKYKIVESDLVKALVNGYICEIQEYSRIRDAGVLTALNNMDKPGSAIPMVDGSMKFRHPDAIVFWTDNTGYVGCRPVDASVTRRIDVMFSTYEMDKAFVMSRLEQNFPGEDKQLFNKLYTVWSKVRTYCQDKEINDGDVSIVELENWVAYVQIFGESDLAGSCMNCIISKAANDPETQEELYDFVQLELAKTV